MIYNQKLTIEQINEGGSFNLMDLAGNLPSQDS